MISLRQYARLRTVTIVLLVAAVTACSGNQGEETQQRFAACGNGVIDLPEECDDGNFVDTDACLSDCTLPTCGDEFVFVGQEECDGRNLNPTGNFNLPYGCADLGFSAGTLHCTADCRFDTSECGPAFTPTATRTVPPTATPTQLGQPTDTPSPSPSPTPTRNPSCGNGTVEAGETCDDGNRDDNDACPSDCTILPCTPSATTQALQVNFAPPSFQDASSITVLVTYPDGTVSIPGAEADATVTARVTMRQSGATLTPNDLDHALRVVYTRPGRITPGRIFLVTFDTCTGAPAPRLEQFSCRVTGCASSSGQLEGCSCTVDFP